MHALHVLNLQKKGFSLVNIFAVLPEQNVPFLAHPTAICVHTRASLLDGCYGHTIT